MFVNIPKAAAVSRLLLGADKEILWDGGFVWIDSSADLKFLLDCLSCLESVSVLLAQMESARNSPPVPDFWKTEAEV